MSDQVGNQNVGFLMSRLIYCQHVHQPFFHVQRHSNFMYRKVLKFLDARKLCCNLSKIQTKSPNLRIFSQKDANGIANSEDRDQTAPLGAV